MNEMVERGAIAIVECEGLGDAAMPQARKFARAAIATMREPTPEMIEGVAEAFLRSHIRFLSYGDIARIAIAAFIDELLK